MNISDPSSGGRSAPRCWRSACCWSGSSPTTSCPSRACRAVDFPTIRVSASRPGADPVTMAATIAAPLERRLGAIAGVTEITSRQLARHDHASRSSSTSTATSRAPRATCRRRSMPRAADLPGDLPTLPTFRKVNPAATPVLILALTSQDGAPSAIYDAADTRDRAAHRAGARRRRRHGQRRRAAGDPRPRRPRRDRGGRHLARGRPHRDRQRQRPGRSAFSTAHGGPKRSPPTTSCASSRDYGNIVVKSVNGNVVRLSDIATSSRARATAARPPGSTGSRRCC